MTDYKATSDQWAYQEHWAQEANTKAWKADHLRSAMLEIARWLECRAVGTGACWLLGREARK
ncbi:MAG: hypothetical protein EBS78_11850 [Altererythrobacter sp.]|nr:hypothetical protein [Altererythrobacter sp.]